MQAPSFVRSSLAQTVLVSLLTLVAVALLGAVLAYWTWAWFAPRAEPRVEAAVVQSGSVASASTLFGTVQRSQNIAAPTGMAIRLLGIVSASGGRRGYAVVQLDSKQILAVHEGNDVAPGIRLAEVLTDHVILERKGVRETLAWPEKKVSASPAPSAQGAARVVPRAAEPVAPRAAESVAPSAAEPAIPQGKGSARRRSDSE